MQEEEISSWGAGGIGLSMASIFDDIGRTVWIQRNRCRNILQPKVLNLKIDLTDAPAADVSQVSNN